MKYGILLSLCLFLRCGSSQGERSATAAMEAYSTDTLTYVYRDSIKISKYFIENDETTDTAYFRVSYPEFSSPAINDLIKSSIWIEGEENFEEAAQAFIDGYDEFVEEETTHSINMPWFKNIQSTVDINSPLLFSLKTTYQEYTGGAHGHSVTIWSNFDVVQGKKIELSDIIAEDNLPELTKRAEKQFRTLENISDTSSLDEDFFFENGIFALNDNFGLTKNDLVFYYNEYEIKPYSEGVTVIRLPYTDLMDILTSRGKEYIRHIQKKDY